jgi:hypothetical protein
VKRLKIDPPLMSTRIPPHRDERPFVDDGLWTGMTWGLAVTLATAGIIGLIWAYFL